MKKSRGSLGSRKGNVVIDSIFVIVILLALAFGFIIVFKIYSDLKPEIRPEMTPTGQKILDDAENDYPSLFDGIFVFVFIMLWVFVIVASFMVDSHPLFFILSLILVFFVIIIAAESSNLYQEIFSDSDLSSYPALFPATNWIMLHLVQVIVGIVASIMISLYAKSRLQ